LQDDYKKALKVLGELQQTAADKTGGASQAGYCPNLQPYLQSIVQAPPIQGSTRDNKQQPGLSRDSGGKSSSMKSLLNDPSSQSIK